MKFNSKNSFNSLDSINSSGKDYKIFNLKAAEKNGLEGVSKLPKSLKVLLENLLRYEDDVTVDKKQILALKEWLKNKKSNTEIAYRPARTLLQDYTGIPAIADLAAMRDAVKEKNKDPNQINPLSTVDLVIDHSVMVDEYASGKSFDQNVEKEFSRNGERYAFLKWGQKAFDNFRVVPPGTGICHQVNLEYLAKVVWSSKSGDDLYAYPDTLVGTDSHTTMVNGLSVLGWGVGGIEAEAAMLGQPISMLIPEVVGVEIKGKLLEGLTATDLVLAIVEMLRKKGVVGKFVEFYGEGLKNLTLADRATIANMAPEYGATCGFFPVDEETLKYLKLSGRDKETIELVEKYSKAQGLWASEGMEFTDTLSLDIVRPLATEMITSKSLCNNVGLINLDAISEKKIDGGYWYGNSIIVRNNQYFFPNGETGEHLFFYVHNHLGCVFEDSIRIELKKAPIISFIQPRQMNLCTSSAVIKLSANPSGGSWVNTDGNDGSINPSQRYQSQAVSTVKYIFIDQSNACKAEDSIKIIINPAVEYFVPSDIAFCSNKRKAFDVKIKNNALATQFSSDGDIELDRIGDETFIIAASKAKNILELASIRLKIKALEGCEDQNITIPIRIKPVPKVGFLPKHEEGCSPFTFEANTLTVNNVRPDWFEWRLNGKIVGNKSTVKHRITEPSGYTLALTAGLEGCQSETVTVRLQVLETVKPKIQSDPTSKIISQDYPFITFTDHSISQIEYTRLWDLPDAKVSNLTATNPWVNYPGDTGVYTVVLHLKTLEGCESKDSINIYLAPKYSFFIPSAFSPNHKGPNKNEWFRPFGDELTNYHLGVYNSLKNKVFETEDFYQGWDGTTPRGDAQAGIYIWVIKGRNSRGVLIEHQGLVTLLR